MKKNLGILGAAAILFLIAGIIFGIRRTPTADMSAVDDLLSRSMPDETGQVQQLAKWKGSALLVNFWATWCAPCVEEMPELSTLQAELAPRKIQILGIGIDSASNITQFAKKYHISYPLYIGATEGTALSRAFGNTAGALPYTVLIGRDGTVKKTYIGRLKMDVLRADLGAM